MKRNILDESVVSDEIAQQTVVADVFAQQIRASKRSIMDVVRASKLHWAIWSLAAAIFLVGCNTSSESDKNDKQPQDSLKTENPPPSGNVKRVHALGHF